MLKSKDSRECFAGVVAIVLAWSGLGALFCISGGAGWSWWFFALWMAIPFATVLVLAIAVGIFFLVVEWIEHGTD